MTIQLLKPIKIVFQVFSMPIKIIFSVLLQGISQRSFLMKT